MPDMFVFLIMSSPLAIGVSIYMRYHKVREKMSTQSIF